MQRKYLDSKTIRQAVDGASGAASERIANGREGRSLDIFS